MKQILISVGTMLSIFFQACNTGPTPAPNDIIGTWESSDGASLSFNNDGTFTGKSLPAEYFTFFTSKKEVEGKKVNGTGKWELKKGQGFEEVALNFQKMNNEDINGSYSVLISGESGVLENQPPWYLFIWKEEEGGDRYKFVKK